MATMTVCNGCEIEQSEDVHIHHQATCIYMGDLEPNILLCDDCLFHAIDPNREPDDVSTWKIKENVQN